MSEPRWPPEIIAPMQEVVRATARVTLRWVATVVVPQIEEHTSDPAERWQRLKEAIGRG